MPLGQLFRKIPLAPVFAFVILLLIDVFGMTVGQNPDAGIISYVAPNYPVIWLVSFLAGYSSRKVLDRLESASGKIIG